MSIKIERRVQVKLDQSIKSVCSVIEHHEASFIGLTKILNALISGNQSLSTIFIRDRD